MGYFDILINEYFKAAQDGRRLFFPWGILGRGYIIPSERDYVRLQRQIKIFNAVALVLIIGVSSLVSYFVSFSVAALVISFGFAALVIVFYAVWSRYLRRGLQQSDERLSFQESTRSRAHALGPVALWVVEIGALAFVGDGIFLLIVDPRRWPVALFTIVCFGLVAAGGAHMIIVRRRAGGADSTQNSPSS
jgi:hypothetical protein